MLAAIVGGVCMLSGVQFLRPHRFFCPWDFPVKKTGSDCHFLLQGTFLGPGMEPYFLLHLHVSVWTWHIIYLCPSEWSLLTQLSSIHPDWNWISKDSICRGDLWRTLHLPNRWSTLEMSNFNITPKWDVKELFPCTIKGEKRLGRPWTLFSH